MGFGVDSVNYKSRSVVVNFLKVLRPLRVEEITRCLLREDEETEAENTGKTEKEPYDFSNKMKSY